MVPRGASSVWISMIREHELGRVPLRDLRVLSLFEDSFSLIPLASWLPGLKRSNPGRYSEVGHLLNTLLMPGQYRFNGEQDKRGDYLFSRGEMSIPFQSLSDGYRAFIGWVGDLLHHMHYGCPPGKKLVDNCGVVLVDEIDLLMHPRWQTQVIRTVAKALPTMQFVFTSHSPLVAGSLEWMNIIRLTVGTKTNRTVAKRLHEGIHGLDADQILLTDFFGLKSTRAVSKLKQLTRLRHEATLGGYDAKRAYVRRWRPEWSRSITGIKMISRRMPSEPHVTHISISESR